MTDEIPVHGDWLQRIRNAADAAAVADHELFAAVEDARAVGHKWRHIAAVLGTTRQAAQQRYGEK